MEDLAPGDLVILTKVFDLYMRTKPVPPPVIYCNRLAKLEMIIDWESATGKKIMEARLATGKWKDLPVEENKYVMSIFYPELMGRNEQKGVVERGVPMFHLHPKSQEPFFEKVPDWMYKEIIKKCESFSVETDE